MSYLFFFLFVVCSYTVPYAYGNHVFYEMHVMVVCSLPPFDLHALWWTELILSYTHSWIVFARALLRWLSCTSQYFSVLPPKLIMFVDLYSEVVCFPGPQLANGLFGFPGPPDVMPVSLPASILFLAPLASAARARPLRRPSPSRRPPARRPSATGTFPLAGRLRQSSKRLPRMKP